MTIHFHENDLTHPLSNHQAIAIDTETMGLNLLRDRLCMVQLSTGDGEAHLIRFTPDTNFEAPNLRAILEDPETLKLFHYARFDVAALYYNFGMLQGPLYCTKIASKLARTYTDKHGLKDLCSQLLGIELDKTNQTSDWGQADISEAQQKYAANDVLYLHALKEKLDLLLTREDRFELAHECFDFIYTVAQMDLMQFNVNSLLSH